LPAVKNTPLVLNKAATSFLKIKLQLLIGCHCSKQTAMGKATFERWLGANIFQSWFGAIIASNKLPLQLFLFRAETGNTACVLPHGADVFKEAKRPQ